MTASSRLRFDIEDAPSDADVEVLPNGLEAFNESKWPGHQQWRPLAVFARDGESIVAGLAGETYSGWLFIRYLRVSDALRGQGIGRKLMGDAEAVRSSAAAIRPGSTRSVSRPRASIRSSGMRYSANSTIRPDTGEYSSRSTLKQRQAHKFTRANDSSDLTGLLRNFFVPEAPAHGFARS